MAAIERKFAAAEVAATRYSRDVGVGDAGARAVEWYRVLPRYLDELAGATGVIRGGVSAADEVSADIVSLGAAELYCSEQTRQLLVIDYGLTESREPNVIIRVPLARLLHDRVADTGLKMEKVPAL